MNLKKAKTIRKLAQYTARANGITVERNLVENIGRRKYRFELIKDHEGNVLRNEDGTPKYNAHFVAYGQMTNDAENSIRGIYRNLKKINSMPRR